MIVFDYINAKELKSENEFENKLKPKSEHIGKHSDSLPLKKSAKPSLERKDCPHNLIIVHFVD